MLDLNFDKKTLINNVQNRKIYTTYDNYIVGALNNIDKIQTLSKDEFFELLKIINENISVRERISISYDLSKLFKKFVELNNLKFNKEDMKKLSYYKNIDYYISDKLYNAKLYENAADYYENFFRTPACLTSNEIDEFAKDKIPTDIYEKITIHHRKKFGLELYLSKYFSNPEICINAFYVPIDNIRFMDFYGFNNFSYDFLKKIVLFNIQRENGINEYIMAIISRYNIDFSDDELNTLFNYDKNIDIRNHNARTLKIVNKILKNIKVNHCDCDISIETTVWIPSDPNDADIFEFFTNMKKPYYTEWMLKAFNLYKNSQDKLNALMNMSSSFKAYVETKLNIMNKPKEVEITQCVEWYAHNEDWYNENHFIDLLNNDDFRNSNICSLEDFYRSSKGIALLKSKDNDEFFKEVVKLNNHFWALSNIIGCMSKFIIKKYISCIIDSRYSSENKDCIIDVCNKICSENNLILSSELARKMFNIGYYSQFMYIDDLTDDEKMMIIKSNLKYADYFWNDKSDVIKNFIKIMK